MANTYSWSITQVMVEDRSGLSDVAIQVCFDVKGEDADGHQGMMQSDTYLNPISDPSAFTPWDNVSQEQVIAWTKAALGSDRVAQIYKQLDDQISWAAAPKPKAATLSWNNDSSIAE